MLTYAVLFYVLYTLSAPTWCWWFIGIATGVKFIDFCLKLYKHGKKIKPKFYARFRRKRD